MRAVVTYLKRPQFWLLCLCFLGVDGVVYDDFSRSWMRTALLAAANIVVLMSSKGILWGRRD